MSIAQATQTLCVRFGRPDTKVSTGSGGLVVDLNLPHLGGPSEEWHAIEGAAVEICESGVQLLRGEEFLAGVLVQPCTSATLQDAAQRIYGRLLSELGEFSIYRAWNYVPQINFVEAGLENYHRFNLGRWQAFRDHFGDDLHGNLPAASAVGIIDPVLITLFIAGKDRVTYVENPEQLPAWSYPERYGPKSPSFSRGTLRHRAEGPQAFLSGTASIKGHETIGREDLRLQCEVTCDNLRLVHERMRLPDPFGLEALPFQAKVYLRHAQDYPRVCTILRGCGAGRLADSATFLQADICRPCLDVEIEMTGV